MQTNPAHNNNFDFLRFLFASLVIFSHSYALLTGQITQDPFYNLTGRVLSEIGVCGFFIISGYLIHQSLQRSGTLSSFFKKRLLRILPGLIVAILFTTLILGTLLSSLKPLAYLTHPDTWLYAFSNMALLPGHGLLPGVFDHNPETAVNGSLWTLRYELLLYALLSTLYFVSSAKKRIIIPVILALLLAGIFIFRQQTSALPYGINKLLYYVSILGSYFFGGALLALFSETLAKRKTSLLLIAVVIFLCSLLLRIKGLEIAGILSFILMTITFGLHYFPVLSFSKYTGDISYGTYIYAFPIQQAIIVWFHPESVPALMIPSFLLSWAAGLLSWHFVEKRFIRRKA